MMLVEQDDQQLRLLAQAAEMFCPSSQTPPQMTSPLIGPDPFSFRSASIAVELPCPVTGFTPRADYRTPPFLHGRELSDENTFVMSSVMNTPPSKPAALLPGVQMIQLTPALRDCELEIGDASKLPMHSALECRSHAMHASTPRVEKSIDEQRWQQSLQRAAAEDASELGSEPEQHGTEGCRRTAPWTRGEDAVISEAVSRFGTCWGVLVELLPGRTCASVRNRWHRLKHARKHREAQAGLAGPAEEEAGVARAGPWCAEPSDAQGHELEQAQGQSQHERVGRASASTASARGVSAPGVARADAGARPERETEAETGVVVALAASCRLLQPQPQLQLQPQPSPARSATQPVPQRRRGPGCSRRSRAEGGDGSASAPAPEGESSEPGSAGGRGYKCSRCGQPKRGHLCDGSRDDREQAQLVAAQLRMRSLAVQQQQPPQVSAGKTQKRARPRIVAVDVNSQSQTWTQSGS